MYKNILILGAEKTGKTTLAQLISKEYGYSIISLDNIKKTFEKTFTGKKDLSYDEFELNFIINYINELCSDKNFNTDSKYVIEGNISNIEALIEKLDLDKITVFGLVYDSISKEQLFKSIRENDEYYDPTKYYSDDLLSKSIDEFMINNDYLSKKFDILSIPKYDVSLNRQSILNDILKQINTITAYSYKYKN